MKVELDKAFPIEASDTAAWTFLQDIPGVAGCMPGAEITETIDDTHFKGRVTARIGPATMAFNGDIEIKGVDTAGKQLQILGRGQDTKGSSSAEMDLSAWVIDSGDGNCELKGKATVSVTGKAASFGGRMLTQVADQLLNQFGKNFSNNVMAQGEGEAAETAKEQLAEQPKELNGIALAWSVIMAFIKSLFGKNKAGAG